MAKESIFSALNNLKVSTVVRGRYGDIFGFTAEEVAGLDRDLGHEDKLEEIKAWCDGYDFSGHEIYNPWSVVNYFDDGCQPGIFWLNTSGNDIIAQPVSQASPADEKRLLSLLAGETIDINVQEGVIYSDVYKTKDALYTMPLTTGYMKALCMELVRGQTFCELDISNMEVRTVHEVEIVNRFRGQLERSDLYVLLKHLLVDGRRNFRMAWDASWSRSPASMTRQTGILLPWPRAGHHGLADAEIQGPFEPRKRLRPL